LKLFPFFIFSAFLFSKMMSQATCKFCSFSDDTIQVICEARCLICSRCQQIPILRKLLIDHTMNVEIPATATQPARSQLKGFCPVCEASMSTTMVTLISIYKESTSKGGVDDLVTVNLVVLYSTPLLLPVILFHFTLCRVDRLQEWNLKKLPIIFPVF
jgi:hypothetical protein